MTDACELGVVIGRFQPFHYGHLALLQHALSLAPRALVIIGSARGPRMAKNPFTVEERSAAILASLPADQQARVSFAGVRDYYDEPRWAGAVKAAVAKETHGSVALVGFRKDASSSYLSLFPEWQDVSLPRQAPIDGTALRRLYFSTPTGDLPAALVQAVPPAVAELLRTFRDSPHYALLRDELLSLDENAREYGPGPFITVDALVTRAEHVLLIQRGRPPGKGLWGLPGGFLDGSERLLSAAMRELREETELGCTDAELRSALRDSAVFDHPQRSQRGRTITHAYHFALPGDASALPKVTGADDAQAARWLPIAAISDMPEQLFEDHFQIIDHFLKISRD